MPGYGSSRSDLQQAKQKKGGGARGSKEGAMAQIKMAKAGQAEVPTREQIKHRSEELAHGGGSPKKPSPGKRR